MEAFKAKARTLSIEPNKFPGSLRAPMDDLLVALAWTLPHAPTPDYEIPTAFLEAIAGVMPFSTASIHRLFGKKIVPILLEAKNKNLQTLYASFTGEFEKLIVKEEGQSAKFSGFNDILRQSLYDVIRAESEVILLSNVIKAWNRRESPDKQSLIGVIVSFLSPVTKKNIYKTFLGKITPYGQETDANAPALLNSALISTEYQLEKKRHERQLVKELGIVLPKKSDTNLKVNAKRLDEAQNEEAINIIVKQAEEDAAVDVV